VHTQDKKKIFFSVTYPEYVMQIVKKVFKSSKVINFKLHKELEVEADSNLTISLYPCRDQSDLMA
jgi:superfamily II DNA/RNA helicase